MEIKIFDNYQLSTLSIVKISSGKNHYSANKDTDIASKDMLKTEYSNLISIAFIWRSESFIGTICTSKIERQL